MKIFTASLLHETLHPEIYPTTKEHFARSYLIYQGQHGNKSNVWISPAYQWRTLAEQHNYQFIESIAAVANPSGTVAKATFEEFQQHILQDLQHSLPIDIVLLNLHGAMVADGYEDCEAELLKNIRTVVGDNTPIGVLMDLHAHHTAKKEYYANAINYYHEYPHTDIKARATELFEVLVKAANNSTKLAMCSFPTRMLNHILTIRQPMRTIIDFMQRLIDPKQGIELVSIAHGFPWSDVSETGVTPLVVYNANIPSAKQYAQNITETLGLMLYAARNQIKPQTVSLQEIIQRIKNFTGKQPLVAADYPDNPGGGALGRSVFALEALLKQQIGHFAVSSLWDEAAVKTVFQHELGDELTLAIGGSDKQPQYYGKPLQLKLKIMQREASFQDEFAGGYATKGDTARLQVLAYFDGQRWLDQANVDIIINSVRDQTFSPKCFTAFGIDLAAKKLLLVKSMFHYRAAFKAITTEENIFTLAIPGRLTPNFSTIPYQKLSLADRWPFVDKCPEYEQRIAQLLTEPSSLFNQFVTYLIKQVGEDLALSYLSEIIPSKDMQQLKSQTAKPQAAI